MKYLKTYNESIITKIKDKFNLKRSFMDWFIEGRPDVVPLNAKSFATVETIHCNNTYLKNLNGIENFNNLKELYCNGNYLKSLKGIENLEKLESFACSNNELKNLNEIKNLPNLKYIFSACNPFEEPISIEIVDKFGFRNIYGEIYNDTYWVYNKILKELINRFRSYEFQKKFLTEHPDRMQDLKPFGYNEKIKEEFPSLIRGSEWGFFDLKEGVTLKKDQLIIKNGRWKLYMGTDNKHYLIWNNNAVFDYDEGKLMMNNFFKKLKRDTYTWASNPPNSLLIEKYTELRNLITKLWSYEFQKKFFLKKNLEKIKSIEPFLNDRIKKEYPVLTTGTKWGFFDLEGGST